MVSLDKFSVYLISQIRFSNLTSHGLNTLWHQTINYVTSFNVSCKSQGLYKSMRRQDCSPEAAAGNSSWVAACS